MILTPLLKHSTFFTKDVFVSIYSFSLPLHLIVQVSSDDLALTMDFQTAIAPA